MTKRSGRACARERMGMSRDDNVQSSDLLRPRHVGAPIKRTEDIRLLTGNGEYAADRKPERALHVAFRRSEQPHARIVRVDASKARAAPGIVAVFTAGDIEADYKPVIPVSRIPNYCATPILALASCRGRAGTDRYRIRHARRCRRPAVRAHRGRAAPACGSGQ